MSTSSMTIERGTAENIYLRIMNIENRITPGVSFKASAWYSVRDASWNCALYGVLIEGESRKNMTVCPVGKGWDFHEAVLKLRANYLIRCSELLGVEESFASIADLEAYLDHQEGVERNEVGAVVKDGDVDIEARLANVETTIERMNELMQTFNSKFLNKKV